MDHLQAVFVQEGKELVMLLEETLLTLEGGNDNPEEINKAFRALHTLKGNCGMFGFDALGELTHLLENVFDNIRQGERALSSEVINVTFSSLDHIGQLLEDPGLELGTNKDNHKEILKKIQGISNGTNGAKPTGPHQDNGFASDDQITHNPGGISLYLVHFKPGPELLKNGTNPLYLVEDLCALGDAKVFTHCGDIPDLSSIDLARCYISWEVFLATDKALDEIKDVFIFVEDLAQIEIGFIAQGNIDAYEQEINEAGEKFRAGKPVNIEEIKDIFIPTATVEKRDSNATSVSDKNLKTAEGTSSIRVSSEKLDVLMNLVSELVTTQARLSMATQNSTQHGLTSIVEEIEKLTRQLRDNAFDICLIPIQSLVTRFKRLIRDLSIELGKEVEFVALGTDTQLDKTIIETLTDPLLHLLRNSMDHGIESPEARLQKNKPKTGRILLNAFHSGSNVVLQLEDDGAGIDLDRVREKAIGKGIFSADKDYTNEECLDIIMSPGFSTAHKVTNVSGRGVGLDVVKRKVENVRGTVTIRSEKDHGTTFTITLPLSMSIIDGLLVNIHHTTYLLPLSDIKKIHPIDHALIEKNINGVIPLEGKQIPFINLRKEFDFTSHEGDLDYIIEIRQENQSVGLVIDEILGEYQAVLKPLGQLYKNQDYLSGATILADGTVALVIDSNKIISHFTKKDKAENHGNKNTD